MKKIIIIIAIISITTACEIFVIGTKKEPVIEINQSSSIGAVLLFKTKLDSNKIPDASTLVLKSDGARYLAIEKVDLFDDLKRLSRQISNRNITRFSIDTISNELCIVDMEFDYIRNYKFNTMKIVEDWFITGYKKR